MGKNIIVREKEFQLLSWMKKHLKKGFKFCLVGSVGAVIGLSVQAFCVEILGLHYILGAIIGLLMGMFNNYFLNYYWTFKRSPFDNLVHAMNKIGFKRTVFERVLPMPSLSKTKEGVLFSDESPEDFYPTVTVPEYLIGKTLFIIEEEIFLDLVKRVKG